ncbi:MULTISPECIES: hypothetical protein [Streptomyces]|nr:MULTISPECIES: hypothetical protein [Streptomyces]MCX5307319.1 hypothetical protein [Streptomyces sp. NBC_00160]
MDADTSRATPLPRIRPQGLLGIVLFVLIGTDVLSPHAGESGS